MTKSTKKDRSGEVECDKPQLSPSHEEVLGRLTFRRAVLEKELDAVCKAQGNILKMMAENEQRT